MIARTRSPSRHLIDELASHSHELATVAAVVVFSGGHYSSRTMAEALEDAGRLFPGTRFVFASEARRTTTALADMLELGRRTAAGLRRMGVGPGDVVAVQVPNRQELVVSYFGAWLVGAVVLPITHIYDSAEVGVILRDAGAKMLILPDVWRSIDFVARLSRLEPGPTLKHVVMIGERAAPDTVPWAALIAEEVGRHGRPRAYGPTTCAR